MVAVDEHLEQVDPVVLIAFGGVVSLGLEQGIEDRGHRCVDRSTGAVHPVGVEVRSDHLREFLESGHKTQLLMAGFDAELVVTASNVLDERVAPDHGQRGPIGSQTAHRFQPRLETAMVPLDPVVRILLGIVNRLRKQLIDHAQQGRRQIRGDLSGPAMGSQRVGEESPCGCDVAPFRHVHVDDLAVLIPCPVHVAPHTGDLHVGLVHEPAVTHRVAARPSCVDEERREALHPPVDGDVVDLDAAFCEEFFDGLCCVQR